jgi:ABC-type iron transport system FetAB permease component
MCVLTVAVSAGEYMGVEQRLALHFPNTILKYEILGYVLCYILLHSKCFFLGPAIQGLELHDDIATI